MDSDYLAEMDAIRNLHQQQDTGYTLSLEDHCAPAYRKCLKVVRLAWILYCSKAGGSPADPSDPFSSFPTESSLEGFLRFLLLTRKGKLSKRLCVVTLKKYLTNLNKLVQDRHGQGIGGPRLNRLRKFIDQGLFSKGASRMAMSKAVANTAVVRDILHYLWALDEYEFAHPRIRLQLSIAMLLLLYCGVRPGEIVESSDHPGSNEGILYKDLEVTVLNENGKRRLAIAINFRNRKGDRGIDRDDIGMFLLEDREHPELCPVAQLLSLAIADRALVGVERPDDLKRISTPSGRRTALVRIRDEMRDVPVLRCLEGRGLPISSTRIMKSNALNCELESLGQRAGYAKRFSAYAIRRGHGNLLDKHVSAALRQKRMGHQHASTFQHYISAYSSVDGQSVVLGRPMEQETLDHLASMATRVDLNAPKPHGASLTHVGRQYKRTGLHAFRDASRKYFNSDAAFASMAIQHSDSELGQENGSEYTLSVINRPPTNDTFKMYLQWDPDRSRVIDTFYHRSSDHYPRIDEIIEPLVAIAHPQRSTWRYPGTVVCSDGTCHCGHSQSRSRDNLSFNLHLLACSMRRRQQRERDRMAQEIQKRHLFCPMEKCYVKLQGMRLARIEDHFHKHLAACSAEGHCPWPRCGKTALSGDDILYHALQSHCIPVPLTLPQSHYCYECRDDFRLVRRRRIQTLGFESLGDDVDVGHGDRDPVRLVALRSEKLQLN